MKILPRTRPVVIIVVSLAVSAAIAVFAQKPSPTPAPGPGEYLAVHLRLLVATCNTQNLKDILAKDPWKSNQDRFKVTYTDPQGNLQHGGNYPEEDVCPGTVCLGNRSIGESGNVTQHFTFQSGDELNKFMAAIELK